MADSVATSIEGPEWKTIELSKLLEETEAFKAFKETLQSIKDKLGSAKDFLDALETLLTILSKFENILTDFFDGFLGGFLEEIRNIIREAKSTGIYALDLTSHNFIGNKFIKNDGSSNTNDPLIRDFIRNDLTFPYWLGKNKTANLSESWATRWLGIYKRQTYRQWLDVAINAFLDDNDKADPTLSSLYLSKMRNGGRPKEKSAGQQSSDSFMIPENALKYIRPGRPNFGPRGYMRCFVVSFTAPDFIGFLQLIGLFSYFLGGAFGRQKSYVTNFINKLKEDNDLYHIGDDYRNLIDWFQKNTGPEGGRGQAPDFIGISAYQLLPELFDGLEKIIDALEALFKKTKSGLAKYIKDVIDFLRKEIQEIRMFIQLIEEIIDFIERLLEFNGALLDVEAYGTYNLVEKLRLSKGFPVPPDQKIYIGGGLFCFGYPTDKDNPGSFDLGKFWKDGYNKFNDKLVSYGSSIDGASTDSDFDYVKSLLSKITG